VAAIPVARFLQHTHGTYWAPTATMLSTMETAEDV
jgi:hypothetical protein